MFAFWVKGTRTSNHEVRAVFDTAPNLYSGLDVRVDGLDAGKIKKIERVGDKAIVTLGIRDDRVWPLRQGTTATLRFGSTIGNGTRIIDLAPARTGAPIPENGIITDDHTVEATEFDDVFNTFNGSTRKALQGTLHGTGQTFANRAPQVRQGVQESAGGLEAVGGLAQDLTADEPALRAFVANTYRATRTLAARRDQISSLVGNASVTFATFAQHTQGITQSLDRLPGTLQQTRQTLGRVDTTVDHLDPLVKDIDPGARRLGALARQLRPALADLRQTIPSALSTFRTARKTAPQVTQLLREAQPTSDKLAPDLDKLAPMVGCIRPYAPDLAGFFSDWTSFPQQYDAQGHVGRIGSGLTGVTAFDDIPLSSAMITKTGLTYALAPPPGYATGQTWYQPQCGITPDLLDPNKDPEANK